MQVELKSGVLSLRLNATLAFTQVDLWLGLSYCYGEWNKVIVKKEGSVLSASMNELTEEHVSESQAQPLMVNSPVYLGGTPPELQESYKYLSLEQGKLPQTNTVPVIPTRFWWFLIWRYYNRIRLKTIPTYPSLGKFEAIKKNKNHRTLFKIVSCVALKTVFIPLYNQYISSNMSSESTVISIFPCMVAPQTHVVLVL